MSANGTSLDAVSRWVAACDLPRASALGSIPSSELRNEGGPQYFVRPAENPLNPEGTMYDMRMLDDSIGVGHIYFHPGSRQPPIPPLADLHAFMAANPELPIVIDANRAQPCERPHAVFAKLVRGNGGEFGLDGHGYPLIRLYTIAADNHSRAFAPATHFKDGQQMAGVEVLNWTAVNFDGAGLSLMERFRAIYRRLRQAAV